MNTFSKTSVSYELASKMIGAAFKKAAEINIAISAWIVDESGVLKAYGRMDYAPMISVDASRKKAVTAVGLGISTGADWHDLMKDDPYMAAGVGNFTDFLNLAGGLPIIIDGNLAGAIGVSGGHYKQDELCARSAIEVI